MSHEEWLATYAAVAIENSGMTVKEEDAHRAAVKSFNRWPQCPPHMAVHMDVLAFMVQKLFNDVSELKKLVTVRK
jgi:hypothetical protein